MDTSERVFESEIEYWLTHLGKKTERYIKGDPKDFDRSLALDGKMLLAFVQETQPDKWRAIVKRHGEKEAAQNLLQRVGIELDKRGTIDCLRHGIHDIGVEVRLVYWKPGSRMNQSALSLYEKKNRICQEAGEQGAGQIHEPPPPQSEAEDRNHCGAFPKPCHGANRRACQGDDCHRLKASCAPLLF